ncbi:endonuclease/exonuclease/phosphatase family protein [Vibrio furnissii]|uniref:endonuclease/exonuclease/phosphatase family protein n=1 Tax=Vibrio furnissii TaxID=29494 RepID=UPI00130265C5|nr:endonuclease/exonuclease/phosphatase family protein [Vibrio furnissii]MCG6210833.1 endonuclease/exonuclease/phosphatase family protein [Vibrio furnissii]
MQVRFATANLFNYLAPPNAFYEFNNIYEQTQWQQKQRWLSQRLTALNADVIGFQEVFSPHALRDQVAALGYPYFEVIDTPHVSDDYIYSSPVVGIASRFPLSEVAAVEASLDGFHFHRKPLRATLNHPALGQVDVYVVHFKSQRPMLHEPISDTLVDAWQQELQGRWQSAMQRGQEAHLLHQAIVQRKQQRQHPVVLMGDFNQVLSSMEFAALRATHRFRQPETCRPLIPYHLLDSWTLFSHSGDEQRQPTHYTGAAGQVLDYILLSSEFSRDADYPIALVSDYHVEDQHLINPHFDTDRFASDHALVSVTVECAKSLDHLS